ncbi:hypothetical protein WJX72_009594 [[Myrmecia] bisecta]|uniref:Uncharacterized protein n=1 Tax=[Myrmecia] bisecta TaxID=41462 RepID=A0AAW1Q8K6_9CHLO
MCALPCVRGSGPIGQPSPALAIGNRCHQLRGPVYWTARRAGQPRRAGAGDVQPLRRCSERCSRRQLHVTALRSGPVSSYNKHAPLTAWSPLRSLQSITKFAVISGVATTSAWYLHPHLLNLAAHVLQLDFKDSVTAFQTSFFSFLSLVFAIYSGNTMAFLYDRQKEMVKNLYNETMALEELLEEAVHTLGPDARDILAQIRLYIEEEILVPENQSPPLGEGFSLSAIRAKARNYRRAGTDVGDILQASQRLAHAQSERQATACRLLPPVHWALLYTIGTLFVSTFILFETGGSFSNEGRHILFTVLCGLMAFVLCALRDLADPVEGAYNATALLDDRLGYIKAMLDKYQKLPGRPANASSTYVYAAVPAVSPLEDALAGKASAAPRAEGPEAGEAPSSSRPLEPAMSSLGQSGSQASKWAADGNAQRLVEASHNKFSPRC